MAIATGAPLPLPSRSYLSLAIAPATSPFANTELPRLLELTLALPPLRSPGRRAIAAARAPRLGEVPWTLPSCSFFAPDAQSSFNLFRRDFFHAVQAPPPSPSDSGRRRRCPPSLPPRRPNLRQRALVW
jgi:hypothetical protein